MPIYIEKQLLKYKYPKPKKPVHTPWEPPPFIFDQTNEIAPIDDSLPLKTNGTKFIQQLVVSFLYYCQATDPTIVVALNELSGLQTKATENVMK